MNESATAIVHTRAALGELERAEYASEDRANLIAKAQVHATLAVADRLDALLGVLEDGATVYTVSRGGVR